jgi:hypothetical protein
MRNLAKPVAGLHIQSVGFADQSGGLNRPLHGRRIGRDEMLAAEAGAEAVGLVAAFVGEQHVGRSGKAVLGGEYRSPVADEEDTRR